MQSTGTGWKVLFDGIEIGTIDKWDINTVAIHEPKPYPLDYSKVGDMKWAGTFIMSKRNKIEKALGYTHYAKNSRIYRRR